ncbi:MAG TPA: vWA domain-containing protein, partial [Candidatus Bathyarchaeia archaeon]|nr:vWA domain-containing protein [Candidatus Bathyarchaeia archaeon]
MFNRQICKVFVSLVLILQLGFPIFPAAAKNFHLSEVTGKSASGIQDLDITISLDWDPETVKKTDADPRGFTKDEFNDVINSFAQSLYSMTNGKHRLRNVYVYTSRHHWDKADVSYISKEAGTAKANVSSWKKSAGRILMYVYEDFKKGKYVLDDSPGPVLAHESGHYIYGLYDEYKETRSDGKTRAQLEKERDFGTPAKDDDGTQKSIMNAHASYPYWFSVDSGYAADVKKNSAQYRMFKKSIWSTLVSDPASDHENAIDDVRTWFDAFKGLSVRSEKDLLAEEDKALDGWDKAPVSIIWMGKTSHFVLVLDNNVSAHDWTQSKNSAAAAVQAMTVDNRVSLLAGESVAITNTKLTDANRSAVITQISSAVKTTSVPVEKSLRKAFDEIKKLRKTQTEEATYFIYLFTSGNPAVSSTVKKELTDAKAMLAVAALAKSQASQEEEEGKISVKQLSEESGGKSNVTGRSQKIGSQIARNINFMEAENTSDIAAELFEGTLPPGNSRSMNFVVGPRDTLLTVGMFSDEEEWNDITPYLIDPYGIIIKEGGLPAGVVLEKDQATGIWLFG